jgi:diketogulonate reductase-like aldo/keto reductase
MYSSNINVTGFAQHYLPFQWQARRSSRYGSRWRSSFRPVRPFPCNVHDTIPSVISTLLGKVRLIGVSNFVPSILRVLLSDSRISVVPACNQVQLHPSLPSRALQELCADKGIVIIGYFPAGVSPLLLLAEMRREVTMHATGQSKPGMASRSVPCTHPAVTGIAEAYNALPTQVILSWAVKRNIPIPWKNEREEHWRVKITVCVGFSSNSMLAQY